MPSSGHHTLSALFTSTLPMRSELTFAPAALARRLIRAQPEERRLPQLAVGRPLGERDLPDELRLHPRDLADPRLRVEGRLVGAERRELRGQQAQRLGVEAGADLAAVAQAIAVVQAHEERPEEPAGSLRRRVSADDELGLLAHLQLQPRTRAGARLVDGALVLRDDALP